MSFRRRLIVNADDFGLSPGVNEAILAAHERGIVTSASLMVRAPHAVDAAVRSGRHPSLSLGIHVDLGEWQFNDNAWSALYEIVPSGEPNAISDEVQRQFQTFRILVGRNPTHIDSHQHVHCKDPVRSVVIAAARELGVPLRHYAREIQYCGRFYGQTTEGRAIPGAITADALIQIVTMLPPGITELACHPGDAGDELNTMYRSEREAEAEALCDPRVRAALIANGIELCSFADVTPTLNLDIRSARCTQ